MRLNEGVSQTNYGKAKYNGATVPQVVSMPGHTEPGEQCMHEDCVAERAAESESLFICHNCLAKPGMLCICCAHCGDPRGH